ncbi:hypothetical protein NDU88_002814 [Pleurodeles waltl]|uniref:Uncharacterized protein n=1 Tax=Pleurodeles waltl TaxID=8319 RepID=A0AAV7MTW2_PLEWA|nr:hypothetical protein NDU88_002814 [Pleurodeles waltl]
MNRPKTTSQRSKTHKPSTAERQKERAALIRSLCSLDSVSEMDSELHMPPCETPRDPLGWRPMKGLSDCPSDDTATDIKDCDIRLAEFHLNGAVVELSTG